jgi:hypothetical protein
MVTGVVRVTAVVVMVNAGETVAPAATVTEAGTVATALLLVIVTAVPPAGAGPLSVTVLTVVDAPPTTNAGDKVTADGLGGCTVKVPVAVTPPYVAVIVTGVLAATPVVVMVNAGETVAPVATVTEAGTVAAALLLVSVTIAPPAGAGPVSVTVFRVVDVPPETDAGDKVTADGLGGCTVKVPVAVTPPYVAVIVTGVLAATPVVVMVNAGETVAPAATVTEAGTVAAALLLVSVTTVPPADAAPFSVTVFKVVDAPPKTDDGDRVTADGLGGCTVKVAVAVTPPYAAVIVTGVLAATADVLMVNAGETDAPAATVTVAGTVAAALLLVSVTTVPPAGAAPFSVTVFKVVDVPPNTDTGDKVTADGLDGNTVNVAVTGGPL